MKILLAHNSYRLPGGEDQVFQAEAALLESRGHDVIRYTLHNSDVDERHPLRLARRTVWNSDSYAAVRALIRRHAPAVMHVHNTLPLLSPSVYHAARAEGVPVVHTLHNYRLLCPNALFFRNGHVCEECLGRLPLPGVRHACYRGSRAASAVVAGTLAVHRALGTWTDCIDVYIALTEFSRKKHIEGGLPADRIIVKPNFIDPDPGVGRRAGGYALYVGRLAPEKGVDTLLDAWRQLDGTMPLCIAGDGPLADRVAIAARDVAGVTWLGQRSRSEVTALLRDAALLIAPSVCYEGAVPLAVLEALAAGLPVLMSDIGGADSVVQAGRTGYLFRPGSAESLARTVAIALANPAQLDAMAKNARAAFEAGYTPDQSYRKLLSAYELARARAAARRSAGRSRAGGAGVASGAAADSRPDTGVIVPSAPLAADRPRRGAFVVVVGPDGVGKTTVARSLIAQHSGPTAYVHFAPPVVGRLAPRPPDHDTPPPDKGATSGSRPLGWLRLARNFARFWAGYLVRVRPALARDTLVVADRWGYGYLGQPRALRFYGPEWLATTVLRWLPRPDLVVNLAAAPQVIHDRKRELTLGEIESELSTWARIPAARCHTFDAAASPASIARAIVAELER